MRRFTAFSWFFDVLRVRSWRPLLTPVRVFLSRATAATGNSRGSRPPLAIARGMPPRRHSLTDPPADRKAAHDTAPDTLAAGRLRGVPKGVGGGIVARDAGQRNQPLPHRLEVGIGPAKNGHAGALRPVIREANHAVGSGVSSCLLTQVGVA